MTTFERYRADDHMASNQIMPVMKVKNQQILVVEDEEAIVQLLEYNLRAEGYETIIARDGEEAIELALTAEPDAILLDWMLPLKSGLEVCRQLRRRSETGDIPIIMLTARSEESDKLRGLDMGADDYLTKPFSPSELLARLRAVLRRSQPAQLKDTLSVGNISIVQSDHRVMRDGVELSLAPTEYRLLRHFLQFPGRVFSREQLLDAVWGRDKDIEPRTVDVHIRRLRKAIDLPGQPNLIRTVREVGYALENETP